MRYKYASDIPYPHNISEAHEAFNDMVAFFGNGEELSFDIKDGDKESMRWVRIALDCLNERISIFHFYWLEGSGAERAIDGFAVLHLDKDDAIRMADILKYFVKIMQKGGER